MQSVSTEHTFSSVLFCSWSHLTFVAGGGFFFIVVCSCCSFFSVGHVKTDFVKICSVCWHDMFGLHSHSIRELTTVGMFCNGIAWIRNLLEIMYINNMLRIYNGSNGVCVCVFMYASICVHVYILDSCSFSLISVPF